MAVAISFIDAINHGDVDRLAKLMAPDFSLVVFDTEPQGGIEGWRGYATAYPAYLIHPRRLNVTADSVAIFGHTTGSHLGLPDEEGRSSYSSGRRRSLRMDSSGRGRCSRTTRRTVASTAWRCGRRKSSSRSSRSP